MPVTLGAKRHIPCWSSDGGLSSLPLDRGASWCARGTARRRTCAVPLGPKQTISWWLPAEPSAVRHGGAGAGAIPRPGGDCHSTVVLVQPITASIQRARVPSWEFSDCPGSHIRRARGATLGRESPEVQVPGGSTLLGSCRLVQGREQSLGPQRQANRCSVVTVSHQEPPLGGAHGQLWECGSAEPVRTGRRPVSAGKNRTYAPAGLLGVEAVAPRKGSMSQSGEGLEPSQDPTRSEEHTSELQSL